MEAGATRRDDGETRTARAVKWAFPTALLVGVIVGTLLTSTSAVPPSAAMLASLAAAAVLGYVGTSVFVVLGLVTSLVLEQIDDVSSGSNAATRFGFRIAIGLLAILLVAVRLRRERELRRQSLAARLYELGAALLEARTVADVARVATEDCLPLVDAKFARLAILAEDREFRYLDGPSVPRAVADRHPSFVMPAEGDGVRRPEARFWGTIAEFVREQPAVGADAQSFGIGAIATIPLQGKHELIGFYLLFFDVPRPFDDEERTFLQLLASQLAVVLERAQLFDVQQVATATLQRSLLGPPVLVERAGHCSRYVPAVTALAVGGDWYDTIKVSEDRIGIAVGDVVGHGIESASIMGQLRSALGAVAPRCDDPADAMNSLDRFASHLPGALGTTVTYAEVDSMRETIDYCSAGHMPPLYVSPTGETSYLFGGRGRPLGISVPSTVREYASAPFPPGSLVALYTDGLVERRGESLDIGFDRLEAAMRDIWSLPIELLADDLLQRMAAGSNHADDTVLLLFRSPVRSADLYLEKFPAVPDALFRARRAVGEWLGQTPLTVDQVRDFVTAVGEACTNAVEHAYTSQAHPLVRIEGSRLATEVLVTVTDVGAWKEQPGDERTSRGLTIMRSLVPDVQVARRASGTVVSLRYPLCTQGGIAAEPAV